MRLGRYEIVGRIATGGMAEVSLGRLRGPHGFERPVVIKRILPHLASDQRFVDMFLDEARLIASLRHPNLVPVHELVRETDELFMVMEFLEGESLAGICRRLAANERFLDYELAAHIVAEACAGLHAAHEAVSSEGRSLGIVHRDVSPQNVLITYSGSVYVIDFGIATSADRVTRTETGTVRGKTEYLAPEQIKATPLDRRVDVFGLGIVLVELATGRRLYKRASPAAAMMAILSEPLPKLASLRADLPEELEAIARRALAKDPAERFATAADMRRALLAFVRKRSDDDCAERLGGLMRELFAERAEEKARVLAAVGRGNDVETLPAAEVDEDVELPTAVDAAPAENGEASTRGTRWGVMAILGIVALLVAGFVLSAISGRGNEGAPLAVTVGATSPLTVTASAKPTATATTATTTTTTTSPTATATAKQRNKGNPKPRTSRPAPSVW